FAGPWRSVEKHDPYRAALRGTKLAHQSLRLPSAIDDDVRPFARSLIGARAETIDSEARQDLVVAWAGGRSRIEQIATERIEIVGDSLDDRGRGDLIRTYLALRDLDRRAAAEGDVAGQRLVEQDTEAVPVACRCGGRSLNLFGAEIAGCPHDAAPVDRIVGVHADGQPEVEQHHAPFGRNHDVGWLEIAMHDAVCVERGDGDGQLPEAIAHVSQ